MDRLERAIVQIREAMPGLNLMENEPMSGHCSFKTGGPVRALAVPSTVVSLTKICSILKDNRLAPLILGNGTNILFPDEGLGELFIISTEKLTKLFLLPDGAIYAEAGVSLSKLATFAQQNGLAGLEFASGIPGSLGGGVWMNCGAYGGEIKDVVESVVCYYLPEQRLYELTNAQCEFGYRTNLFHKIAGNVILSAVFRLQQGGPDAIATDMRRLNEQRREKQPLDLPSAGSVFKRPEGHFAGALIEAAGLKGRTVGGAQVSEKHAGFIVNTGNASSQDVYDLMLQIREEVYKTSEVYLEPELIIFPPDYKLEDNTPEAPKHIVTRPQAEDGEQT